MFLVQEVTNFGID